MVKATRTRVPGRPKLREELTEVVRHREAISEVLRVIAGSTGDLQPIFDTILASASRLCRAKLGALILFEEDGFRVITRHVAGRSDASSQTEWSPEAPVRPLPLDHPVARLIKNRSPVHISDLAVEKAYLERHADVVEAVESNHVRTCLLVPMLKEAELIGAITIVRTRVEPFTNKQTELTSDFAAQAAIALEITGRERRYRQVQMELAHANRVATMGQLTASIAHELGQPLSAAAMSGDASLLRLTRSPPEIEEAKRSVERTIKAVNRACDVIDGIRSLVRKNTSVTERLDINDAIREVIALTQSEVVKNGVTVRTQLAENLPCIRGDRVQLQQVTLNLIINAIQAMSGCARSKRGLHIRTESIRSQGVRVAVRDSGPGLSADNLQRLFEPFYTTKPNGMGMGLSICRSIIEGHGGRLWAIRQMPQGALFQFTIPATERADRN